MRCSKNAIVISGQYQFASTCIQHIQKSVCAKACAIYHQVVRKFKKERKLSSMVEPILIKGEWRSLLRSKTAVWLLGAIMLLSVFAIWRASVKTNHAQKHRKESAAYMRDKFTAQGEVNPHSAAHYGHYVYKPLSTLSAIDNGVNDFTGVSLYLEGHRQNEAGFSAAEGSSSLVRFGQLTLALVLQILMPLFIIFICHNAISREKEGKTLNVMLSQGISLRTLIWAKTFSYTVLWTAIVLINLIILWLFTGSADTFSIYRLVGLGLIYTLYYFVITALAVFISAASKTSGSALLKLLFGWLLCTVLLPKITANMGDNLTPLLTRMELDERISADKKNGIDGHNSSGERTKQFKDSLVKSYNVSTADSIPVNLDGLLMQADEEYNNVVYDRHIGTVQEQIRLQNNFTAVSSWINPFAAVRNLSMGLAGTDVYHHFDFMKKAEEYRRIIIKKMNDAQAYGGSKTGDWDWSVHADFWKSFPDFNYHQPSIGQMLDRQIREIASLLVWMLLCIILIHFLSNRLSIIK
jgi:ABC-2 type transport system permease protein